MKNYNESYCNDSQWDCGFIVTHPLTKTCCPQSTETHTLPSHHSHNKKPVALLLFIMIYDQKQNKKKCKYHIAAAVCWVLRLVNDTLLIQNFLLKVNKCFVFCTTFHHVMFFLSFKREALTVASLPRLSGITIHSNAEFWSQCKCCFWKAKPPSNMDWSRLYP